MTDFEIVGVPSHEWAHWLLDASAKRGMTEVRVATPWGPKLLKIENYRLLQETAPDEVEYLFAGEVGKFAIYGAADVDKQSGNIHIDIPESEDSELLLLLKKDAPLTPEEWFFGWDAQQPRQD